MKRMLLAVLLLGGVGLWSAPALALLNLGSCTVNAGSGVDFGQYDPNPFPNNNDLEATAEIHVRCSSLLNVDASGSFNVYLNAGNGSFAQRKMYNGSNVLNYNLYTSSGNSSPVWGDGTGGTEFKSGYFQFPLIGVITHREAFFTIFGRIPRGQFVPSGSYSDTIKITVTL